MYATSDMVEMMCGRIEGCDGEQMIHVYTTNKTRILAKTARARQGGG